MSTVAVTYGPQLFPRISADRDELGYPLLAHECPACCAMALIINEWDAVECLTCSWREFGPDSPRGTFIDWEAGFVGPERPIRGIETVELPA